MMQIPVRRDIESECENECEFECVIAIEMSTVLSGPQVCHGLDCYDS